MICGLSEGESVGGIGFDIEGFEKLYYYGRMWFVLAVGPTSVKSLVDVLNGRCF
ncbi:MAG: hypothetical protein ABIK83_00270 [Candidatus Zixiibacteriota bacterium]